MQIIEDMGYAAVFIIAYIIFKYLIKGLGKLLGKNLEHHH